MIQVSKLVHYGKRVSDNSIFVIAICESVTSYALPVLIVVFIGWEVYKLRKHHAVMVQRGVERRLRETPPSVRA